MKNILAETENQQLWEQINKFGPGGDLYAPRTKSGVASRYEQYESTYADIIKDNKMLESVLYFGRRRRFIGNFAWAVPDLDAISAIKTFANNDTILEINAGLGLWARLLKNEEVKVIPTDIKPKKHTVNHCKVHKMNHKQAIEVHGIQCNVLMTVWPNYKENYAAEALRAFKGDKLIYIGEGLSGCNADDEFHTILDKEWDKKVRIPIPRWWGLRDYLHIYTRD